MAPPRPGMQFAAAETMPIAPVSPGPSSGASTGPSAGPEALSFTLPLLAGAAASALSSVALVVCGHLDGRSAAAPTNATAQWLWGRRALLKTAVSARYTVVGYLVHHAMSTLWAVIHCRMHPRRATPRPLVRTLTEAAGTAALAYVVDYTVTPQRLRPGFEHHLSGRSMLAVYAAFALGLAVAMRAMEAREGARGEASGRTPAQAPARSDAP